MAQGESPRNPLAFASVLYHGRCLASQPILLGSEEKEGPWFQQGRILNLPTLRKLRSWDASWDWRGHAPPQGGGPPRGGDRHAILLAGDPRGAKGLGAWS